MSLEKLLALVTPPEHPIDAGSPDAWPDIERNLGTPLPNDYKQIVNVYGLGWFANWIYVASPFSARFPLAEAGFLEFIGSGREKFPQYYHPFSIFPTPGGLLPWGGDDNAGVFCWLTEGSPDNWTSIFLDNKYSDDYNEIRFPLSEILSGWFAGEITGNWYPDDIAPMQERVFTSGYRSRYSSR